MGKSYSITGELNLPLAEVLARFSEGPSAGIFTDGSCQPNPGPGGWGCVLVKDGKVVSQRYGKDPDTTNNRMELTGIINGLELLSEHPEVAGPVTIFTDSELCVNTFNKWADGWAARGWKRKTGPIANLDLVQRAYALYKNQSKAKLEWIKAHNGWLWNEYADSLSTAWTRDEL